MRNTLCILNNPLFIEIIPSQELYYATSHYRDREIIALSENNIYK